LERVTKTGLCLTFIGFFLLVFAESLSSAVFWGGLTFFIIGIVLLLISMFWKIAVWADNKISEFK
jgi:hypothetical protein